MKRTLLLTIGLALVILCGCAVLTVDVDVYTGPLANTVEVQAEQVIALVMGAKPLLVQLRDHLEVASYTRHEVKTQKGAAELIRSEPSLQDDLTRFRSHDWYWAGFFAPQPGSRGTPRLRNDNAIRVNDILALYEDRTPWDLSPLMDRGRAVFRQYTNSYAEFRPADTNVDVKFWEKLTRELVRAEKGYTTDPNSWAYAYWRLLVPTSNNYYGPIRWREGTNLVKHFPLGTYKNRYTKTDDSNAIFDFLCHSDVMEEHADKLFGSGNVDIKKQFKERVRRVAGAFLDTRVATHELLIVALEAHMLAFRTNTFGEEFIRPLQRETVKSGSAEVIAATLEPWLLAASITDCHNAALMNLAQKFNSKNVPVGTGANWCRRQYLEAKEEIKKGLADYGASLSAALLALDEELQRSSTTNEAYRFGLAQGPNCDASGLVPSTEICDALRQFQALANSPFAGGRPQQGMETLIEDYLRSARTNRWFENRSQSSEFTLLLDALVAFGEKVAILGNTATLLDSMDDSAVRSYRTVLQYVGNAISVHVDELKNRAQHQARLKRGAKFTAQFLREAGFSNPLFTNTEALFFTTNELDAKDVLEHLLDSLRAHQIKAILDQPRLYTNELAMSAVATNATTNTLIVVHLATNVSLATTTNMASSTLLVTNVISVADTSKVASISLALTNRLGVAPVSDKFLRAIDRVTEMKNNRIYLRPASAYLRSSHPATTLRPNASVGWQNQLEAQMWRSVPLIGRFFSGDGSRHERAKLRELDKQSWQNINRVRVSGSGNVNYAIAKDDVGNWYVKSYSADPSNIVKSARNLAMFSAGGIFRTALSNLAISPQAGPSTNAAFAAQFDKAAASYQDLTTNTWNKLTNQLLGGTFSNKIHSALSSGGLEPTNLTVLSNTAFSSDFLGICTNVVPTSAKKISDATSNTVARVDAEILNVLHAVKRYHATVLPRLNLSTTNQPTELKRARQEFTRSVREFLDDMIAERQPALDRFEGQLEIIHGATGP